LRSKSLLRQPAGTNPRLSTQRDTPSTGQLTESVTYERDGGSFSDRRRDDLTAHFGVRHSRLLNAAVRGALCAVMIRAFFSVGRRRFGSMRRAAIARTEQCNRRI